MTQLEVVTASYSVSIPFVESADDFAESMHSIVANGMDAYYDDVALIRIPQRDQWVSQSPTELHDARINPPTSQSTSQVEHYRTELSGPNPCVTDLASYMEEFAGNSFVRQNDLLRNCYIAAPAYDATRSEKDIGAVNAVHLGIESSVSFDGLTLVAAMKRGKVPTAKFDYPLLEPVFRGYYIKEVGSYLLDVAGVGDFGD